MAFDALLDLEHNSDVSAFLQVGTATLKVAFLFLPSGVICRKTISDLSFCLYKGTVKWQGRGSMIGIIRRPLKTLHFRRFLLFLKEPRPKNSKKKFLSG